jgi:putative oxidoreductase
MVIADALRRLNCALEQVGNAAQPALLLAFRTVWGWQFFQTGLGKLQNHERVVEFFTSLGIPAPALNAWFVGGVECLGGILLAIGLFSRPIALLLAGNMLVAYLSVEEDRQALLGVFSALDPFLTAAPFFFLLASTIILVFGPGKISLDRLIARRAEGTKGGA